MSHICSLRCSNYPTRASTYQQLAIQLRACPISKGREICQSMTSLAIRCCRPRLSDEFWSSTASFAALSSSLCGNHFPTTTTFKRGLRTANYSSICMSALQRHYFRTDARCLACRRRRAGPIFETGTARAITDKEEGIVAAEVPNASTRSYCSHRAAPNWTLALRYRKKLALIPDWLLRIYLGNSQRGPPPPPVKTSAHAGSNEDLPG